MTDRNAEELAKVLFDGDNPISDVKLMPGTDPTVSPDHVAEELWRSMERVGLIRDGKVVNRNIR